MRGNARPRDLPGTAGYAVRMIENRRLAVSLLRLLGVLSMAGGVVVATLSIHLQEWWDVSAGVIALASGCWLVWKPRSILPDSYWQPLPPV